MPTMRPSSSGGIVPIGGEGRDELKYGTPSPPSPMSLAKLTKQSMLATSFKSDLMGIKALCTCSVCDQFLYEPFTIACGHTYCYSCLCSWFANNKNCPECRARVKVAPSPNFLVKNLVTEILIKRIELLPADESLEQHSIKRREETQAVEDDKASERGLFKGVFKSRADRLRYDEEDGVARCPQCGHEYEGGSICLNCGLEVEEDDTMYGDGYSEFSDEMLDGDGLHELELDIDSINQEIWNEHGPGAFYRDHASIGRHMPFNPLGHHHIHHGQYDHHDHTDHSGFSDEDEDEDDDDDEGSLADFIAPSTPDHSSPAVRNRNASGPNQPIEISDDESDEGGAIRSRPSQNSRSLNRLRATTIDLRSPSPAESFHTSATAEAETREHLQQSGWSPLEPTDSDVEADAPHLRRDYDSEDYNEFSDYSTHTETMGRLPSDDGEEESDRSSATPTYIPDRYPEGETDDYISTNVENHYQDSDADSETSDEETTDQDGDTDMSVSPRVLPYTFNPYRTNPYNNYDRQALDQSSREISYASNYEYAVDNGPQRSTRSTSQFSESDEFHSFPPTDESSIPQRQRSYCNDASQSVEREATANNFSNQHQDSSDSSPVRTSNRRRRAQESASMNRPVVHNSIRSLSPFSTRLLSVREDPSRRRQFTIGSHTGVRSTSSRRPYTHMNQYREERLARRYDPLRSSRSPSVSRVDASSRYQFSRYHSENRAARYRSPDYREDLTRRFGLTRDLDI